jgi:hypothetical protein
MTQRQIVLIDLTNQISFAELSRVAAALQKQVQADFAEQWDVTATVTAGIVANLVPGVWPIYVVPQLDVAGLYGYHYVDANQVPYAKIQYRENWTITASHELLEMLVNPTLDRYQLTDISANFEGDERFLVEVAGPVQSIAFGYLIDGVLVSNFMYPAYFDLLAVTGKKYDHLGVIQKPRSILDGGYVSFLDNLGQWWQAFGIQNKVDLRRLGESTGTLAAETQDRIYRISVSVGLSIVFVYSLFRYFKRPKTHNKNRK